MLSANLREKIRSAELSLRPPIRQSELHEFETRAQCCLPDEFREFLISVANGGFGDCQLLPLSEWNASYWSGLNDPIYSGHECLLAPEHSEWGENWIDRLAPDAVKRWDAGTWDPMVGTIAFAEEGCGIYHSIVMNGPHRGRVFEWGDFATSPPIFGANNQFLKWFESQLDAALRGDVFQIIKRSSRKNRT